MMVRAYVCLCVCAFVCVFVCVNVDFNPDITNITVDNTNRPEINVFSLKHSPLRVCQLVTGVCTDS